MSKKALWLVFGAALLARFFASGTDTILWPDSKAFIQSAWALLDPARWADFRAERTPGYPLFLILNMGLIKLFDKPVTPEGLANITMFTQALLGCFTAVLLSLTVQQLFKTPWLSLIAGLVCALSPNLILYEHYVLTESLYAFLLTLYTFTMTHFWEKPTTAKQSITQGLLLGGIAALLIWVRHIALVIILCTSVYYWLTRRHKELITYCALVFLAIGSWTLFQYHAHGFLGYSAGSGLNQLYKVVDFVDYQSSVEKNFKQLLWQRMQIHPEQRHYEAVNDVHVIHAMQNEQGPSPRPYDEIYLQDDRAAAVIVKEAILQSPVRYLVVTGLQLGHLLLPPETKSDPHNFYWGPLLLLGLLGLTLAVSQSSLTAFTPLSMIGFITAGQILVYPWMTVCVARYRIPLEPLVITLAAYALLRLCQTKVQQKQV